MKKILICFLIISSILCIFTLGNNFKTDKNINDTDFSNLTISYLGDSITMDKSVKNYPTTLNEEMNFKYSFNYGISSSSIAYQPNCICHNGTRTHDPFVFRYNEMVETDIILINGGINDWQINVPIGYKTSNDVQTFYGALNKLVSGLKTNYPNSYILFITGFNYKENYINKIGNDFELYNNAIIDVCKKYRIDYYDTYHNITFDRDKYTYDTIHPNNEFISKVWVPEIANFIRQNYKKA